MKHTYPGWLVLLLLLLPLTSFPQILFSQENMAPSQPLKTAKILDVVAHPEGRVFDLINESPAPVYDGYPFYDIKLGVGNKCYVVRYEAQTGYYSSAWKPGNKVQARVGKGVVYLLRYDGEEVPARILQHC
jgi:hypothetical protein